MECFEVRDSVGDIVVSCVMVWFCCEYRWYVDVRDVHMSMLVEMNTAGFEFSFPGVKVLWGGNGGECYVLWTYVRRPPPCLCALSVL